MDVAGKVALITGSGVRLGRAMALALAQRGARIVVHYRTSREDALLVVEGVKALGSDAIAIQADLRDVATPQRLVRTGVDAFGGVDILINSAAIFRRGTLDETSEVEWDAHFDINLKAPFFLCQAYAQHLVPRQRGHIINMADWRALRPGKSYMAYILTKGALVTMTQSLALALGPNVQVNAIAPGAILPPPGDEDGDAYFRSVASRIPAKRTGSPREIVKAMLYLLESDFVTGEVLRVTGGEHL